MGTVSKFYQPNRHGPEQNKKDLLNEARLLKTFNGRVGAFRSPVLTDEAVIFEENSPIAAHFIGFIPMTKLEGRTNEWHQLSQNTTRQNLKTYLQDMGSLIASIDDEATKVSLTSIRTSTGFNFNFPWVTDPELTHIIDICKGWLEQNQQEGFIHADLGGRNIMINKNNRIQGVLDFSFSGTSSNSMHDFYGLIGDSLAPAIKGYESTSGKKVDKAVIEMTQIQGLGSYISTLVNAVGQEKDFEERRIDFEKRVRTIAKDLALQ